MANDLWLPRGFALPNDSCVGTLLFAGERWQIFDTNRSEKILLVSPKLAQKWCEDGFLDESLFENISFGSDKFRVIRTHESYTLAPVQGGCSPDSKIDALAFALSLYESRKISKNASLHDAIYVEQYSRLLPGWTLTPHVDDEVVLGTWLTGGVGIPTSNFRRLAHLTGWMPIRDLLEIVSAAGLMVKDSNSLDEPGVSTWPCAHDEEAMSTVARSEDAPATPMVFRLPGRPKLERFFNDHIVEIIFNAEKYQALGIDFPSAIVLHGPPGCGKTFAVERLIEFIDWPCYAINSDSVGSPYIHETSKRISEVFNKAIDNAPSVVVIDEMESYLSDRHSGSSLGLHHIEEVAEFLRRIPQAIKNKVLIIAMTNRIDMIDAAILRTGRFDHHVEVGMPSREEVASVLGFILDRLPKADRLDLTKVIDKLTGRPLSDSSFVIREAARLAAKADKARLDQESIDAALNDLSCDQERSKSRIGFVQED